MIITELLTPVRATRVAKETHASRGVFVLMGLSIKDRSKLKRNKYFVRLFSKTLIL